MSTRKSAKERLRAWHEQNLQELLRSDTLRILQAAFLDLRWKIKPDEITSEQQWLDLRSRWLHELHPFPVDETEDARPGPPLLKTEDGRPIEKYVWWMPADWSFPRRPRSRSFATFRNDGWADLVDEEHEDWPRATAQQLFLSYHRFAHQIDLLAWQFWLPEEIALWAVLNPSGVAKRFAAYLDANPLYPAAWTLHWQPTSAMVEAVRAAARSSEDVRQAAEHLRPSVLLEQRPDLLQWLPPNPFGSQPSGDVEKRNDEAKQERIRRRPGGLFHVQLAYGADCPEEAVRAAAREAKAAASLISKVVRLPQVKRHRVSHLLKAAPALDPPPGYDPRNARAVEGRVLDAVAAVEGEEALDADDAEFATLRHRTNARRYGIRQIRRRRYGQA